MQPVSTQIDTPTSEYISFLTLVSRFYEIEPRIPVVIDFGARTDVGRVREQNEDHYLVVRRSRNREILATSLPEELLDDFEQSAYVLAVADGMGGRAFGEMASFLALRTGWDLGTGEIKWTMKVNDHETEELRKKAQIFFDLIHRTLQATTYEEPRLIGMGTTLTLAYSTGPELYIMHAGDSRAYLYRDGTLRRLTRDHNLAQQLIDAGLAEEGSAEERRTRRILTNCLGGDQTGVAVDVEQFHLKEGDRILLCTDGLNDMLEDDQIAHILSTHSTSSEACEELVNQALEQGGKDNVTVVLARYSFPQGVEGGSRAVIGVDQGSLPPID